MKQNHYGVHVDSETPITGVVAANSVSGIHEDITNGIDLDFEQHCKECRNEYHDDCWESQGDETVLIGKWKKSRGKYAPDKSGDFAAIVNEVYAQVVWSKTTKRVALCSPCYPGQGDLDSAGDYLAFDFPAEMYQE